MYIFWILYDSCYVLKFYSVKHLVMLFTLLGFHLFMLNQYHFNLGYFNWFILFADVNILVFCYFIVFWFLKSSFFFKLWWYVINVIGASLLYTKSRSEPNPNIKGKRRFVPQIWTSVRFCDISNCQNVTLLNFVTFLGFCHTYVFPLVFVAKPLSRKNVEMSQMLQIRRMYRALFRRSANFHFPKLLFAVVCLGQSWYWPRLPSRFEIWLGTTLFCSHKYLFLPLRR